MKPLWPQLYETFDDIDACINCGHALNGHVYVVEDDCPRCPAKADAAVVASMRSAMDAALALMDESE